MRNLTDMHFSMIEGVKIYCIKSHIDHRGNSKEIFRFDQEEDKQIKMGYISWTVPGTSRGPHSHKEQDDLFIFIGPGNFELRLWDCRQLTERPTKEWADENLEAHIVGAINSVKVSVPAGVVHGYKNISEAYGMVINLPNQLYRGINKAHEIDEIKWELESNNPFSML